MNSVNVTAESVAAAADILGLRLRSSDIGIFWRRSGQPRYRGEDLVEGCIVDATGIRGEEVKRVFPKSSGALRYIASILKRHDAAAREQRKKDAMQDRADRKAMEKI